MDIRQEIEWKALLTLYTGLYTKEVEVLVDPLPESPCLAIQGKFEKKDGSELIVQFTTTCRCPKKFLDCLDEVEFTNWPPTVNGQPLYRRHA